MYRIGLAVSALAVATGCTPQSVTFDHQSELEVSTRGVVLTPGGERGQAGMMGTTCAFETDSGGLAGDYDYPGTSDTVQDVGMVQGDLGVVVLSDDGVHVTFPDAGWHDDTLDIPVGGDVLDARVSDGGVVALVDDGDCAVTWAGGDPSSAASIGVGPCAGAMAVDPATGDAWVAADELLLATPDGVESVQGIDADLLVWDASADVLYAARTGDTRVHAIEARGDVLWTADLDAPVGAMTDMGQLAGVALMLEESNGSGRLVVLDAFTGEFRADLDTPSAPSQLEVDADGRVLAMVLPSEVHFFKLSGL